MKILERTDTVIKIEIDTIGRPNHEPCKGNLVFVACPSRLSKAFNLDIDGGLYFTRQQCIKFVQNGGLHTYFITTREYEEVSKFIKSCGIQEDDETVVRPRVINPIMELEV